MSDFIDFVAGKASFHSIQKGGEAAVIFQLAVIIDTVEVRTEADGVDTRLVPHIQQMLDDLIVGGTAGALLQEGTFEVDAHDSTVVSQGLQLVVGQVSPVIAQGSGAGMRRYEGFFTVYRKVSK